MLALSLPTGAFAAIGALTLPLTALSFAASVIGACWVFWFKRRLRDAGIRIGTEKARYEAMAAFHDALLDNGMQGIVVDPGPGQSYFGSGKALFERVLEGADAPQILEALDALVRNGTAFYRPARVDGGILALRGAPVGKRAVLYIGEQVARHDDAHMIDHLPLAIATFDPGRKLVCYNAAYAELWDLPRAWLDTNPSLGAILNRLRERRLIPEQRNFSEWKKSQIEAPAAGEAREETWHLPSGKSVRLVIRAQGDGGLFLLCEDISEQLKLESSLNLMTQVQKATLDTLDEGVAIFGANGRLVLHNALFAKMWRLTESDLTGQPHLSEIAGLCAVRIGQDGIWGIIASGVNSASPERFGEWGKARRADGRTISLALARLPNGATLASFADLTDVEEFRLLQHKVSDAAGRLALGRHPSA
jgi:PAS domain-containing protein